MNYRAYEIEVKQGKVYNVENLGKSTLEANDFRYEQFENYLVHQVIWICKNKSLVNYFHIHRTVESRGYFSDNYSLLPLSHS